MADLHGLSLELFFLAMHELVLSGFLGVLVCLKRGRELDDGCSGVIGGVDRKDVNRKA